MEKENKKLLKFANEQLKERGYKLSIKAEDNTYRLDLCSLKGKVIDNYADGYFEEELPNLINDALLCYLRKEPFSRERIYILDSDADILDEKEFNEISDKEILDMYDAGSDYVDCFEDLHDLASAWNAEEIFYPTRSYARVIRS